MPYLNYNHDMNIYMKKRYHERRRWAIEFLGGKCVKCGAIDNLEMDHIDPFSKSFAVAKMWSIKWERFVTELHKCQLLYTDCHKEKSSGVSDDISRKMKITGNKAKLLL